MASPTPRPPARAAQNRLYSTSWRDPDRPTGACQGDRRLHASILPRTPQIGAVSDRIPGLISLASARGGLLWPDTDSLTRNGEKVVNLRGWAVPVQDRPKRNPGDFGAVQSSSYLGWQDQHNCHRWYCSTFHRVCKEAHASLGKREKQ